MGLGLACSQALSFFCLLCMGPPFFPTPWPLETTAHPHPHARWGQHLTSGFQHGRGGWVKAPRCNFSRKPGTLRHQGEQSLHIHGSAEHAFQANNTEFEIRTRRRDTQQARGVTSEESNPTRVFSGGSRLPWFFSPNI